MKNIGRAVLIALTLALVSPVSFAEETKAAPKVEVKTPATQPVVAPAAAKIEVAPAAGTAAAKSSEPAPEPTVSEWWKVLLKHLMELAFTILGIMATVFITVLMKKYGFEDYSNKVNDLLSRGVSYAEQMSIKAAKLNGKPLAGAEKMELALGFVEDMAKQYKIPDKGKDFWTKKIEGWLGANGTSK